MEQTKKVLSHFFQLANIELNGTQPQDIRVNHPLFYSKALANGTLSFGEAYMDGLWDCDQLDQALTQLLLIDDAIKKSYFRKHTPYLIHTFYEHIKARLWNLQSVVRADQVGKRHYNIDHQLYALMLDSHLQYSCGYWKEATNLEQAQQNKLELICRKLQLQEGMTLLDIGCGWGGLLHYAATNYGVKGVGITISSKQQEYAQRICKGLAIDIRLQDYRSLTETFDRIVSIGMFEHVGVKNYRAYMQLVAQLLKDRDSLFLLHTIGNNITTCKGNPWINKYIFPNGMLPSVAHISAATKKLLVMEDWHNFGADYDLTLMSWYDNFATHWSKISHNYSERFYRMWRLYLLSSAALFRSRRLQLWQIVFSRAGVPKGYTSIR